MSYEEAKTAWENDVPTVRERRQTKAYERILGVAGNPYLTFQNARLKAMAGTISEGVPRAINKIKDEWREMGTEGQAIWVARYVAELHTAREKVARETQRQEGQNDEPIDLPARKRAKQSEDESVALERFLDGHGPIRKGVEIRQKLASATLISDGQGVAAPLQQHKTCHQLHPGYCVAEDCSSKELVSLLKTWPCNQPSTAIPYSFQGA